MGTFPKLRTSKRFLLVWLATASAFMAAGCGKPAPAPAPVRAVKTFVFGSDEANTVRSYAAEVRAIVRSSLAFQVAGRIVETRVGVGDQVQLGDVLARLDERPLELRVQQALAELRRAGAAQVEAEQRAQSQRTLLASGFGTRQDLDQAISAEAAAQSAVQSAASALELSRRDVASAVIRAPHSGVVAARTVESFAEVQAGQVVFELDGLSGVEIVSFVPLAMASHLRAGQALTVRTSQASEPLTVEITSIGRRSTQAETVPVIVKPTREPAQPLVPGGFAELQVAVTAAQKQPVVPVEAVLPATASMGAAVFVVGQEQKLVRQTVELGPLTPQGVVVKSGLREGDTIVSIGVGFLRDGQPVRLLGQSAQ